MKPPLPTRQPDIRSDYGNGNVYFALVIAGLIILIAETFS